MNLTKLKEPFNEKDIEWRIQSSGLTKAGQPWAKAIAYITARAAQDRLDEVVGADKWSDNYLHSSSGVMCSLKIKINDEWVEKQNGSDATDIEAFKGGISAAFKRAASNWGIGRYLYDLSESFVQFSNEKTGHFLKMKEDGKYYHWIPPPLPQWALPKKEVKDVPPKSPSSTTAPHGPVTVGKN